MILGRTPRLGPVMSTGPSLTSADSSSPLHAFVPVQTQIGGISPDEASYRWTVMSHEPQPVDL